MERSTHRPIVRYAGGGANPTDDVLVVEAPVEFRLSGVPVAVLMRTPGNDAALALGFALSESIVLHPDEFVRLERVASLDHDDRWDMILADGVTVDPEQFRRNLYTTSSCGLCGKASIDAVRIAARVVEPGPDLDEQAVLAFPERMRRAQVEFDATGGIHGAAAFAADGELLGVCEDIGRHNAVDKLIGFLARERWPLSDIVLTVSGRVSFEIVQKAAVVGIPVVCGVSAASSLAAELGDEMGMTIIGFLRDGGFNVYAGPERLVGRQR